MTTFSTSSTITTYPKWPYETIKNTILGKQYVLSLSFVGKTRAQSFNIQYRKKDYVPNVLSFPLDAHTGEIIICPMVAKKQAKDFNLSVDGYIAYLFIHGCVHLKGHDHGDTMDRLEQKYVRQFKIT
ncbi:MAG: rRNA maturation RNase YbeY [Candidatus Pacebacteria bacterium]|nr:rRNA maturation RNase YbeY [Candidatus Paceibacterota bacterium]MBP9842409.1 rRNA maturation RNase YbeY [Candidatus Paceibacterota bacterium]